MPETMEDTPDLIKEGEDCSKLPTSNSLAGGSENVSNHSNINQPIEADVGHGHANKEHDSVVTSTTIQVSVEVNDSKVIENKTSVLAENGSAVQDGSPTGSHKRDRSPARNRDIDAVSGIKRPRITVDEQQASVHVIYNSLTRESKRKLEEMLQKWSEWHTRHQSSARDSNVELESGEGTYFPALDVGLDKPSAVSFWLDGETRNLQSKEVLALDNNSIPLYDRGYSSFGLTSADGSMNVDGGLEIVDGSRCFNCGSYSHALKDCPKPRDNAAVNSARKQHKARRNQNSISRNPTRYYQDTPGGKFDGLRPGVLDVETRKLLGIGELDPPPWLNRMREIGYPPGYLDAEDEEQPSGIEIFGEEAVAIVKPEETEDGEILDMDCSPPPGDPPRSEAPKKMSVQFPGVNAPIPENADEWRWGARAWKFDLPRNRSSHRFHNSTEGGAVSRSHYHEERWSRDYRDDGPPGVEPGSGSMGSGFSPRFGDYESRGSGYGRSSWSERVKRSPLIRESGSSHDDERWNPYSGERKERHEERHHHHSRSSYFAHPIKVSGPVKWLSSINKLLGFPAREITRLAAVVGCKEGKIPFRYLGLPIGADMHKKKNWKPLIEKFECKLANWKEKTLSVGGRISLCKAVLGALGVFYLSMFKAPRGILKEMEMKRCHFFWGTRNNIHKTAWVAWNLILNSREKGGLGIGSIRALNLALLAKWWWRYKTEKEALWRKTIAALHGDSGNLGSDRNTEKRKGTWGFIANIDKDLEGYNIPLEGLFQRNLGSGTDVKFWLDEWCGRERLADRFPRLAALDENRNCSLAERISISEDGVVFKGCWRRRLREGRETEEVNTIADLCKNVPIGDGDNRWTWALEPSGLFCVASLRRAVDDMFLARSDQATLWNRIVPTKVRIFCWKAMIDRLPTKLNLIKRGVGIENDFCDLCSENRETADHILVNCRKAVAVRRALNSQRNMLPISCSKVADIFEFMCDKNQTPTEQLFREVTGHAYLWTMWIGRNEKVFNQKSFDPIRTANGIKSLVFLWFKSRDTRGREMGWLDHCCNRVPP
ncbi:hypothetical protein OSB04_007283 [Centaurea solstitialis]|uniref:CCHC-type domain-containing protein n=1 Tax=Centaurea solstitialis TaxID=347529 RepID=A0AA38TJL5_9ASTR|nr:hypothetical protein OSB04_007283 [Centaurea solstitialis]